MSVVRLTADDRAFIDTLIAAENQSILAANRNVATINRVSEISLISLQAIGVAVDATFRIQAIAVRTAINTFIQTRAALTIGNPLLAAETLITGGIMLVLLHQQLRAIETGRAEVNTQMGAAYTLLRQAGGVYI